jgi:hypothetical protein
MHLTRSTVLIARDVGDIGRSLAAHGKHAVRARRRVCSYLLWRLQRSEMSLLGRVGNFNVERLEALGIRGHEIESLLTATLEVVAQAPSEHPAAHSVRGSWQPSDTTSGRTCGRKIATTKGAAVPRNRFVMTRSASRSETREG